MCFQIQGNCYRDQPPLNTSVGSCENKAYLCSHRGVLTGLQKMSLFLAMQLTNALRDHAFVDLDAKHLYSDAVVNQLGKEIENGRLLRLLIKLSTITERADTDTQWSETGKLDVDIHVISYVYI